MRWFRKHRVGYGWTPCSWQGWATMAAFTAVIVAVASQAGTLGQERTLECIGILTVILLGITVFTSGKDSDP